MSLNTTLSNILSQDDCNANEIEKYLEQDSACVNKADSYGEMLMLYIQSDKSCKPDVIKLLLKYGANVNFTESGTYHAPLISALQKSRDTAVIKVLLENGADMLYKYHYLKLSPLCVALCFGASKDVVKLLLDVGCPLNGCPTHSTALHCAIGNPTDTGVGLKEEVFDLLIESIGSDDTTVICKALRMGCWVSFIKMLLKADFSLSDCVRHPSPFHCALYTFKPLSSKVAKLLLDNHISVNVVNSRGQMPIQTILKCRDYDLDTIELLLHHLADADIVDKDNNNLFNLAVMSGAIRYRLGVVEHLIKRGVRIDMANRDGNQPLHIAAMSHSCSPDVVKLLLKNGALLNAKYRLDETPLQVAIRYQRSIPNIKVLFAADSHVGTRNPFIFRFFHTFQLLPKTAQSGMF